MKSDLRKSGIEIVGKVPWGTHFCQFYQNREDLIEILVPYFEEGLKNNEFCIWVTAEPLNVGDAKSALKEKVKNLDDYIKKGQIEILDYNQLYTKTGRFDTDKVIESWVEKEKKAIERGFDGLRVTGNTFWLEKKDWESFANYEAIVNRVGGEHRTLAMCSYYLDKCKAYEIIDVINNHQFALMKKEDKWVFLESSERKHMEEELRESEKKYRQLIETLQEGIWVIDKDANTTFVNPRMAEMLDYTVEEMLGKSLFNFMDENGVKLAKYNMERRKQGFAEQHDFEFTRKDGSRIYTTLETSSLSDEKGNFVGALAGVINITRRKLREEELKKVNLELKEIQERLIQFEKMSAKGELAANIAHEIRNPLSVISMAVQYLQTKFDTNDPRREYTESIIQKVEKLDRIARGLADYSKSPRLDLKSRNINGILAQTLSLVKPKCKLNNIQIIHNLKQLLPAIVIDEEKIDQVFLNIVKNAIDAMPRGGDLIINSEFDEKAKEVVIKIRDTGKGIVPANYENIFIPFFTTKKEKGGIGLGLAISQNIIQAHKGCISVASNTKGKNKGTTFIIRLPITLLTHDNKSDGNLNRI